MNKEYIYFGKIVNTHGIKGEIRIITDFERKNLVLKPGFKLYISDDEILTISNYRHHKIYEMVILEGYNNINEVLKFVGKKIYIKREDLNLDKDDYVYDDLIGLNVIENDEIYGKVKDIINNNNNILLEIDGEKHFYIPMHADFIIKVDLEKGNIIVKDIKGLML